ISTATARSSAAATARPSTPRSTPGRPTSPATASTRTASAAIYEPATAPRGRPRRPLRLRPPDDPPARPPRRRGRALRQRLGPRALDALLDPGDPHRPPPVPGRLGRQRLVAGAPPRERHDRRGPARPRAR